MQKKYVKFTFLAVIILQIASIFYLMSVYHRFVDNLENYYMLILSVPTERNY